MDKSVQLGVLHANQDLRWQKVDMPSCKPFCFYSPGFKSWAIEAKWLIFPTAVWPRLDLH
jgi:hypothetical protein